MSLEQSKRRDSPPPPYNQKEEMRLTTAATNYGYIPDKDDSDKIKISADVIEKKDDISKSVEIEIDDPWKISNIYVEVIPWSGKAAGSAFAESQILANPAAGLMIGILATVLLQSSSTTSSIVVNMVASKIIPLRNAIPIVMGANIGTSLAAQYLAIPATSAPVERLISTAGKTFRPERFKLVGGTFEKLVMVKCNGYLLHLLEWILNSMQLQTNEGVNQEFLKVLTKPFTNFIIQVDKKVIEDIANGVPEAMNKSMIKHCCVKEKVNVLKWNTSENWNYRIRPLEVCVLKNVSE